LLQDSSTEGKLIECIRLVASSLDTLLSVCLFEAHRAAQPACDCCLDTSGKIHNSIRNLPLEAIVAAIHSSIYTKNVFFLQIILNGLSKDQADELLTFGAIRPSVLTYALSEPPSFLIALVQAGVVLLPFLTMSLGSMIDSEESSLRLEKALQSILVEAVSQKELSLVRCLVEFSIANLSPSTLLEPRHGGCTLLQLATICGSRELINLFLDPSIFSLEQIQMHALALDTEGWNVLHGAAELSADPGILAHLLTRLPPETLPSLLVFPRADKRQLAPAARERLYQTLHARDLSLFLEGPHFEEAPPVGLLTKATMPDVSLLPYNSN
ncbi:MAG: hypothetical protein ACOYKZ_03890, partial [Chlamydiia bacterium]